MALTNRFWVRHPNKLIIDQKEVTRMMSNTIGMKLAVCKTGTSATAATTQLHLNKEVTYKGIKLI